MQRTSQHRTKAWLRTFAADVALNKRQWILGALVAVVGLAAALYVAIVNPSRSTNWGFGPEWDCGNPVKASALVCIKRLTPPPK